VTYYLDSLRVDRLWSRLPSLPSRKCHPESWTCGP